MRELVYLSHNKLNQFLAPLRSSWPQARMRLKAPLVELDLEPRPAGEDAEVQRLEKVVAHIRRQATWYSAIPNASGQWVTFVAPMSYVTLWDDIVFFLDEPARQPEGPGRSGIRLLLHGNAGNLVAGLRPPSVEPPAPRDAGMVERIVRDEPWQPWHRNWASSSRPGYMEIASRVQAMDALESGIRDAAVNVPDSPSVRNSARLGGVRHTDLAGATRHLVEALDQQVHPDLAVWVAGYARVTTSLIVTGDPLSGPRGYVVASPLYVETAPDPAVPSPRRGFFGRGRNR
jgi:hypothetical protein